MILTRIKVGDYVLVKPNRTSLREFDMKVCVVVHAYSSGNFTLKPVKRMEQMLFNSNEVIHLGRSKKLIEALYGVKLSDDDC